MNIQHFKTYLDANRPYLNLKKIEEGVGAARGTIQFFAIGNRAGMGEKEGEIIAFFKSNLGYDPERQYDNFV